MSFARNLSNKCGKKLLGTGLDALKPVFKKVILKVAAAAGEFIEKKITDKIEKPKHIIDENSNNIEEITIPPEKKEISIKWVKTSIIKMEYYKISRLINDSTVSKFAASKWIKVNDLSGSQYSGSQYSVNKYIRFKTSFLRSELCD